MVEWGIAIRVISEAPRPQGGACGALAGQETTENHKNLTRGILFNNMGYPTVRQLWRGCLLYHISHRFGFLKEVMCLRNGWPPILVF
jgi:hypothetical protein